MKSTLMMLIARLEEMLRLYERSTPSIDQTVVDRVLQTIARAQRVAGWLPVLLLALATGCSHKENPPVGGTFPGQGMTTTHTYTGAVTPVAGCVGQTCRQSVTVNADVIDYPSDSVLVYLCRNADCANGPVPAVQCSQVWNVTTAPCYTSTPASYIVFGKNVVQFINAFQSYCLDASCTQSVPGYSTYLIQTTITR